MDTTLELPTLGIYSSDSERAAIDSATLDRWQAPLPEPFNFLNELLHGIIDDVLLTASVTEAAAKAADQKPVPDEEGAAALLSAPISRELPAALAAADSSTLMASVDEGVCAVALADGSLWLWDVASGAEPQALAQAGEGLVPCELAVATLPPSTNPPPRRRLMLLAAKPAPPPDEEAIAAAAAEGLPPPAPVAAGPDDAQLIVLDLAPPALNLGGGAWDAVPLASDLRLAAFAPAKACLSSDGRFAACALSDGRVACYHLPLPPPAPPSQPTDSGAGKMAAAPDGTAPPAAPPPAEPPQLVMTTTSLAAPRLAVAMHFLLAPAPRSVGEALCWSACGLLLWGEGTRSLQQVMLPSRSALSGGGGGGGAAAAEAAGGEEGAGEIDAVEWLLPGALTASAVSADSVLLATGLDEGSVVLWDTNVRSERYVLQRHGAAVTKIALMGASLLASYAADHTLHGYDVSPEPETGLGKLVFRRRLDENVHVRWLAVTSPLPLVLIGCDDSVRLLDIHGDMLAKLAPSPPPQLQALPEHGFAFPGAPSDAAGMRELLLDTPGPCANLWAARQYAILCLSKPIPTATATGDEAAAEGGAEEGAPAEEGALAEGEGGGEGGGEGSGEGGGVRLECFSLVEAITATYPHIAPLLGAEPTVQILRSLLREYKHDQRLDTTLMASVPLLAQAAGLKGGAATPSGKSGRKGGSRAGSVRGSQRSLPRGGGSAGGLGAVPEDDVLQASRVSSSKGSATKESGGGRRPSRAGGGADGGAGLSEQALLARQQSTREGGSSGPGSTIDRSINGGQGSAVRGQRTMQSAGGGSSISGGNDLVDRRSIGQSIGQSVGASSAGTALSDASRGEPPFVDPISKVQRLQRARLHGRFARESRVQRRWEELKAMAANMTQQQQLAQKGR